MNNTDAPSDLQHAGWSKRHDDDGRSAYSDDQPAAQPPNPGPMTPSLKTLQPSDADMGEPGDNEDERLDEALQESMTTSDPVSIKIAQEDNDGYSGCYPAARRCAASEAYTLGRDQFRYILHRD